MPFSTSSNALETLSLTASLGIVQSDIEEMKGNLAKMSGWMESETDESQRKALEFAQQSMIRRLTSLNQSKEYFVKRLDALDRVSGRRQKVLDWIRGLITQSPGFNIWAKSAHQLLSNHPFPQRLGRDDSLQKLFDNFQEQLETHRANTPPCVALNVAVASPGSGKSFLLDSIGSLSSAEIDRFCQNERWRPVLQSGFSVNVSYAGDLRPKNPDDRGSQGLGARVLFRAFYDVLPTNLKSFDCFFRHLGTLDPSDMSVHQCLQLIAELAFPISLSTSSSAAASASNADRHSSTAVIFLGLDEISQSESEIELMPQLVGCANVSMYITGGRFVSILPIITSRSQSFMNQTGVWFDHPKSRIPMPAYLPGADHMLLNQLQLGLEFLPTVRVLCRALGNHGRLLEVLHDLLQPAASSQALRRTLLAENKNAIEAILRAVVADERGRFYFESLQSDFKSLVRPICHALIGNSLKSVELDELHMKGVFIGELTTRNGWLGGRFPVMAPLQVLVWSEQVLAKSEHAEMRALATTLIDMFSIKAPFLCMTFEQFHAGSELTRRLCFQLLGGFPLTLLRLFNLIRFSLDEAENCLSKGPDPLLTTELDCRGVMERVQSNPLSDSSIVPVSVALPISTSVRMEMNASTRGSSDIAIHQRLKPSGSVTILEHFTWSSDPSQVEKERLKWLKKVKFASAAVDQEVVGVFVAVRCQPPFRHRGGHPSNIILLDNHSLKRVYGPTLLGSHRFEFPSDASGDSKPA